MNKFWKRKLPSKFTVEKTDLTTEKTEVIKNAIFCIHCHSLTPIDADEIPYGSVLFCGCGAKTVHLEGKYNCS